MGETLSPEEASACVFHLSIFRFCLHSRVPCSANDDFNSLPLFLLRLSLVVCGCASGSVRLTYFPFVFFWSVFCVDVYFRCLLLAGALCVLGENSLFSCSGPRYMEWKA